MLRRAFQRREPSRPLSDAIVPASPTHDRGCPHSGLIASSKYVPTSKTSAEPCRPSGEPDTEHLFGATFAIMLDADLGGQLAFPVYDPPAGQAPPARHTSKTMMPEVCGEHFYG